MDRGNLTLDKIEGFDWNEGNATKNKQKHNVEIKESEEVFFNKPLILLFDPKHSTVEERRFGVLGKTDAGRKLAIYFTVRNGRIRIISSRDMSKKDRAIYLASESERREKG